MKTPALHADHIDATGAYAQKFEVVKQLFDSGLLKEIPEEFAEKETSAEIITTTQEVIFVQPTEEFDMQGGHADHMDETGKYRDAYEQKYGAMSNQQQGTPANTQQAEGSWKSFLQKIIAEEKSKLKI